MQNGECSLGYTGKVKVTESGESVLAGTKWLPFRMIVWPVQMRVLPRHSGQRTPSMQNSEYHLCRTGK